MRINKKIIVVGLLAGLSGLLSTEALASAWTAYVSNCGANPTCQGTTSNAYRLNIYITNDVTGATTLQNSSPIPANGFASYFPISSDDATGTVKLEFVDSNNTAVANCTIKMATPYTSSQVNNTPNTGCAINGGSANNVNVMAVYKK